MRTEVRFRSAFLLPELDAPLPAGTYRIDTHETLIGGMERSVYLRTATLLFVEGAGTTRVDGCPRKPRERAGTGRGERPRGQKLSVAGLRPHYPVNYDRGARAGGPR